jgi:cation diffusion facilitator family transporter
MPQESVRQEIRSLRLVVIVYVVIFIIKLIAYFASGVMALLAEALHTLSDFFISGFLLIAVIWSQKSPDEEHMFGHGRAQNVAALVAATLFISFTSYKLYEEAVPRLFSHETPDYRNLPVALGVLIVSMVIAGAPLVDLLRQKTKGAAAKAQFLELINDELGLLAALGGTIGVIMGFSMADPLASIGVATIIAFNALGLFRENLAFLLGKAPSKDIIDSINTCASSIKGVHNVHGLRAEYVSPSEIHVDFHIVVDRGMAVEKAEEIAKEVRTAVQEGTGAVFCTVHVNASKEDRQELLLK